MLLPFRIFLALRNAIPSRAAVISTMGLLLSAGLFLVLLYVVLQEPGADTLELPVWQGAGKLLMYHIAWGWVVFTAYASGVLTLLSCLSRPWLEARQRLYSSLRRAEVAGAQADRQQEQIVALEGKIASLERALEKALSRRRTPD